MIVHRHRQCWTWNGVLLQIRDFAIKLCELRFDPFTFSLEIKVRLWIFFAGFRLSRGFVPFL
jgi:hypothetical protein